MKKLSSILFVLFVLAMPALAQQKYKGLPVIKANAAKADYKIGKEWTKGTWSIMPELSPDVMLVPVHNKKTYVMFRTDLDSISFQVKPGKSYRFYVQLNEEDYALTKFKGYGHEALKFNKAQEVSGYTFLYEQNQNNEFLQTLRKQYQLDALVAGAKNDTEKALRIVNWVHRQWKHDGMNEPSSPDALTILAEVKEGKNFRCVEYGIVTTAALNAIDLPARTMGLKMKEVETIEYGAGHVVLEVFLPDLNKWVMLDGQFDVMPVLNNVPLNAVEFQQAIATNYEALEIRSLSGTSKSKYVSWVYPYLYYFDVKFDNREGIALQREKIDGKSSLMLVPAGANIPKVFQIKYPMEYLKYTHSLIDLYEAPKMTKQEMLTVK
ncbi:MULTISPECIES: transglutaminase-like domain-containing protein [Pontibacter]|uniref:Transglutaminase-like superfamily protein n=1 Tax=Pontibacter lucknowensis TaxID=1077936 RepID=A0A1N7A8B5_9BACT|nr:MULTISPECIES: transglutaminase-like domain-containing protein [Pontibacter]EJF11270.1 transglutaminase domain protein [Pontibacter sp. BAB1700]SIR35223.1 Transglutaminase-like superfamily protein [Pontibacter lucknowensis]